MSDAFTQPNSDNYQARTLSLGLGLTNECNLACSFCYRDPNRVDRLTLDQVKQYLARVNSANFKMSVAGVCGKKNAPRQNRRAGLLLPYHSWRSSATQDHNGACP